MADNLSPEKRSKRMSKVKGVNNESTEMTVERRLVHEGIVGWTKHSKEILGRPDFYFPELRLVIFVDGCFWHGCPVCDRRIPQTRSEFWRIKIDGNRRRDARIRRSLRRQGYHVSRIWEHELSKDSWFKRISRIIHRLELESGNLPDLS